MTQSTNRRRFLRQAAATGMGLALGAKPVSAGVRPPSREPYAAAEIAERLGISMAVFARERLNAGHVATIRQLGIQRIELLMAPKTFDFEDRKQVKEVLAECRRQGVSIVSVHGNLPHKYNDPVEAKRRRAAAALLEEVRFSIDDSGRVCWAETLLAYSVLVCRSGDDQPRRTASRWGGSRPRDRRLTARHVHPGGPYGSQDRRWARPYAARRHARNRPRSRTPAWAVRACGS